MDPSLTGTTREDAPQVSPNSGAVAPDPVAHYQNDIYSRHQHCQTEDNHRYHGVHGPAVGARCRALLTEHNGTVVAEQNCNDAAEIQKVFAVNAERVHPSVNHNGRQQHHH